MFTMSIFTILKTQEAQFDVLKKHEIVKGVSLGDSKLHAGESKDAKV